MASIKYRLVYIIYFITSIFFIHCYRALKETSILLFNGTGSSPNDVKAVASILSSNHLDFTLVNTIQLNELDTSQLGKYKLIIIPGGDFIEMGKKINAATINTIQYAVRHGLNYLGICAGGFLAGNTQHNSFNFTDGIQFKFYAAEDNGIRKDAIAISNADSTVMEQYWEDGPQFSGWGEVVSMYPDGTPATVQGTFGSGWIILTGVHPEAPETWRHAFHFNTTIERSHRYAVELIKAALDRHPLPHF